MHKEIKKLWIDALRSGKYKQGRHRLKSDDGSYCCLGVLAEVCGILNPDGTVNNPEVPERDYFLAPKAWRVSGQLPDAVWEATEAEIAQQKLIEMNDDLRLSFGKIADFIDKML